MSSRPTTAPETRIEGRTLLDWLERFAVRLPLRTFALVNAGIMAALGTLGVCFYAFGELFHGFDLNGEVNAPATYSAALWFSLGIIALLLGRIAGRAEGDGRIWFVLSGVFVFNSADEYGQIHERLESYTGVDWQILYSPLILVAFGLWILAGRRLRKIGVGLGLFILGTAWCIASQVAEAVEYGPGNKPIGAFDEVVVFEEVGEMIGATLIGLALLKALQALSRRAQA